MTRACDGFEVSLYVAIVASAILAPRTGVTYDSLDKLSAMYGSGCT